jgi:hypothetical protein
MTTNATELGTSASTLSTLAKRLGLPLPRAGHWMKKEVGREPPTPEYPANPSLDDDLYEIAVPQKRPPTSPRLGKIAALLRPPALLLKANLARISSPARLGFVIAARCFSLGTVRAPRRSPVGSRSARVVATA